MRVRVVPPQDLSPQALAAWESLVVDGERFRSPFLSPVFALAAARATGRVRVAVAGDPERPAAFFPFQQVCAALGWAAPVGAHLSDHQGIVYVDPPENARSFLAAAGIHLLVYDHLHPSQSACGFPGPFDQPSPRVRLAEGYWDDLERRQRKLVRDTERCTRRLAAEHGPLSLLFSSASDSGLRQLMAWKRAQYARTGVRDALAPPWARALLHLLHRDTHPSCQGILSVLYAGDRVVAMHFGLRACEVLHYWFPAYDRDLHRYSPGRLLLVHLLKAAAEHGIRVLDLGKGEDTLKTPFANDRLEVAEGWVSQPTLRGLTCKTLSWARWQLAHAASRLRRT